MRFFADNSGAMRRIDCDAEDGESDVYINIKQHEAVKFLKAVVHQLNAPFWSEDYADVESDGDSDTDNDGFMDGGALFDDDEPAEDREPSWTLQLVLNKGGEKTQISCGDYIQDGPEELFWALMEWFKPDDEFEDGYEYDEEADNIINGNCPAESYQLSSGIFWVITESNNIEDYKLLIFDIPCDSYGNITEAPKIQPNAKKGLTYNHKKLLEEEIKGSSVHRPYNKKAYDHYPRGRVEISNKKATVFLNPHVNKLNILNEIKQKFGLIQSNISEVQISEDHSNHYQCFVDREE